MYFGFHPDTVSFWKQYSSHCTQRFPFLASERVQKSLQELPLRFDVQTSEEVWGPANQSVGFLLVL